MSGHMFLKERWFGFDDGLYNGARLVEILSHQAQAPTNCSPASRAIWPRRRST